MWILGTVKNWGNNAIDHSGMLTFFSLVSNDVDHVLVYLFNLFNSSNFL